MAVEEGDLTLDKLDAVFPRRQLSGDKCLSLRSFAVNIVNENFGDDVARLSEIEGDETDFAHYVWAALILARNGESSSESQSGGSVSYNVAAAEIPDVLPNNRFGRLATKIYLRQGQSVGIVKGRSNFH
jgi:hypothetical protein